MDGKNLTKITIIGSINTDMVIRTQNFPLPGETNLGDDFFMFQGGKGANQAVAAKRLGGTVSFIGKIGNDIFGHKSLQLMKSEKIDVSSVCIDYEKPSGIALITINSEGENTIVVAPGSNGTLLPNDVDQNMEKLYEAEFVLLQLEIPIETVKYIIKVSSKLGKKIILNPAPGIQLSDSLLRKLFILTPNETEMKILTGISVTNEDSAKRAATLLKEKGVEVVIITMGATGAFVLSDDFTGMIKAPQVKVVDTTAAGDTFNGALVVALSERRPLHQAVEFACKVASISVTKVGAQSSIPFRDEIF